MGKKPCFVEFHTARDGWEILEFAWTPPVSARLRRRRTTLAWRRTRDGAFGPDPTAPDGLGHKARSSWEPRRNWTPATKPVTYQILHPIKHHFTYSCQECVTDRQCSNYGRALGFPFSELHPEQFWGQSDFPYSVNNDVCFYNGWTMKLTTQLCLSLTSMFYIFMAWYVGPRTWYNIVQMTVYLLYENSNQGSLRNLINLVNIRGTRYSIYPNK